MRTLAVLLLLSAAVPATAQQPVITDFGTNGMVTWSNPDTNAFFATDWTWNLNYNWIQMDSVARATQSVMHTSMWDVGDPNVAIEEGFLNLRTYAESMGDNTDALFVRIRISSNELWSASVTNWLRVCNASTSALQNLTFGIECATGTRESPAAALLPAGSNTAFHAFDYLWPAIFHPWGAEVWPRRYFIAYTQAGQGRDFVTDTFLPIGPLRKEITFTVSNDSYTVSYDWLPHGARTTEY